jgi:predicted nucleic acid-binding protein
MGILFDTSFLIQIERSAAVLPVRENAGVAAITVSELLHGVLRADARHRPARQAQVEAILGSVEVVPFDDRVARVHATLWADLERGGRHPGAHHLLIAATAIALGWSLATLDERAFGRVPGLALWRPTKTGT